jgi:AcrR family transcriptional regulator
MLQPSEPKFRRRKADRPGEIVRAAMQVFAEKGFAAARLEDIARRAGVSKGALYLYFETKEDLFRAVVDVAIAPNIEQVRALLAAHPGPFADLLRALAVRIGQLVTTLPVGGVIKMVIGEAGNFPELARVWHDRLVAQLLGGLTEAVARAQARGEVKPGDPRVYAIQLVGPILLSVIWDAVFAPIGAEPFDVPAVARQHMETMIAGLAPQGGRP